MDQVKIGSKLLTTVMAVTSEEQARGLMHQSWPPPIMSFVYARPQINKFWMKNTPSPLDLVFCCNGKVIDIIAGEPNSIHHIGPDELSDLVVEMPRGLANKLAICIGQDVKVQYSLLTVAKIYQTHLSKIT